jgi:hypothetical protein
MEMETRTKTNRYWPINDILKRPMMSVGIKPNLFYPNKEYNGA